jgi:hypothetical protein
MAAIPATKWHLHLHLSSRLGTSVYPPPDLQCACFLYQTASPTLYNVRSGLLAQSVAHGTNISGIRLLVVCRGRRFEPVRDHIFCWSPLSGALFVDRLGSVAPAALPWDAKWKSQC